MLPSMVLTPLNGAHFAACRPEPVRLGQGAQPAVATAPQQLRPSPRMLLPTAKSRLASFSTSFLRKPLTTVSRSRLGLRSGVVSTATTKGVLPGEPRPRLPPGRSPPRSAWTIGEIQRTKVKGSELSPFSRRILYHSEWFIDEAGSVDEIFPLVVHPPG